MNSNSLLNIVLHYMSLYNIIKGIVHLQEIVGIINSKQILYLNVMTNISIHFELESLNFVRFCIFAIKEMNTNS